jgi:protein-S-isoprenylcysteine O-methyltransferase Ste14
MPAASDAADVIAPPPLIYLGGLALGFGLELALPSAHVPPAVRWGAGGALAMAGGLLARSFFRALGSAGTPISPYRATSRLVTTGPYRISRNPGYLGMTLGYAGTALLFGALWPFATLVPTLIVVDRGVIAREMLDQVVQEQRAQFARASESSEQQQRGFFGRPSAQPT